MEVESDVQDIPSAEILHECSREKVLEMPIPEIVNASIEKADRHALSSEAMELLKIDSFTAMAKMALPDIREEALIEAKKRIYSQETFKALAKKIIDGI